MTYKALKYSRLDENFYRNVQNDEMCFKIFQLSIFITKQNLSHTENS